ncbi:uncharacterized protein LOC106053937 [Biomphalaria glabrata]|uniref:Uncharacterized protein LOC106053937 n=1 Tax=Biomphalaria glabrata TaxID=6526 RepID=A0A9U8DWY6_BIOGL|nr:uncharacterized protein LOC106053937 [Biomphalaria glabrata]XP_013065079.2 uncharacterized protein LOC106053937 [Biomphalaria glabrata]XP_013065080.2 uncharacterized protein LOC106053937 [Biomphalaria glabrata]XP_013065081.2 uncharacterized protein LOC106053937 [Biomphalaria glabrata]
MFTSFHSKTMWQFLGDYETQVSEGGEADLDGHYTRCAKNPGHKHFIPVDTFSLEDLPVSYRDPCLSDLIKATAGLTVRVSVPMTSSDRPAFWPSSHVPYPFYSRRGSCVLRTGTGRVMEVNKIKASTQCTCQKCVTKLQTPKKAQWELLIMSAAHVVYDDTESKHTSIRLFYDRKESPDVILHTDSIVNLNIEEDRCMFKCVTCDKKLGDKLKRNLKHWESLWFSIDQKYRESKDVHKLSFIVSHPHGCRKMVSIGQWVDKQHVDLSEDLLKFTYRTCTCPGSSGAQVYFVGYIGGFREHVHSGSFSSEGLNFSGIGIVF